MGCSLELSEQRLLLAIKRKEQTFDNPLEVAYYILREADKRTEAYKMAQQYVDSYKHFKDYLEDKGVY